MGFIFGIIKRLIKLFIYFLVFAAIVVLIPNLPPYSSFTKINLEPLLPLTGPLASNDALNNIQKLYTGKLVGPEAFELHKGEVYTSLATGEIVKLSPGGHVTFVTQLGQPCSGIKEEHKCGRPLGFLIDGKKNLMYVADAYHGIWTVNLDTNKKTLLVSPNVEIDGQRPKLFNSVALDSKGNLYYTDSTTEFPLYDGALSMMTDPSGRLFQYNAAKNESKVLLDKLWFANGLVVSPDDEFIVVAETSALRLTKYYLNGPKKGQKEVFIGGLPGYPDNLRLLPDGSGLQAALYAAHGEGEPQPAHALAGAPLARKLLARLQCAAQAALTALHQYYPHVVLEDIIYSIGHFKSLDFFTPKTGALLHVDWNGNIKNAYFHTDGEINVSDGLLVGDKVYLGQPHGQDFVAVVPAPASYKAAFTPREQQKQQVKREAPPPTTTPKPTQKPKATEPPKAPTPTPVKVEPVVKKVEAPKTTTPPPPKTTTPPPPKTTTPPPKTTTPPPPKPSQQPPKATQAPPKPAQQAPKTTPPPPPTTTPKPAEKKVTAAPPPAKTPEKPKEQAKVEKPPTPKPAEKKPVKPDTPKEKASIPIKEEIPVDTVKPSKETLKVIKKAGPAEIPNPEL